MCTTCDNYLTKTNHDLDIASPIGGATMHQSVLGRLIGKTSSLALALMPQSYEDRIKQNEPIQFTVTSSTSISCHLGVIFVQRRIEGPHFIRGLGWLNKAPYQTQKFNKSNERDSNE